MASQTPLSDSESVIPGDVLQGALEKIESRTAPGELTPNSASSPRPSIADDVEKGEQSTGDGPITHRPTGIKWFFIMSSILVGLFLFSLDNTVVADIQPAIVLEFQSVQQISWLGTGFFLSATALMLPFGQFYQIFNAKWLYVLSVVIFQTGSALCGGSPNMTALIIGRVIAGLGGTGIYAGSLFLISVNTSDKERPLYFGLTGAMWGIGTVLGPVVGGAFTDSSASWRWAFYINLPIGALVAPFIIFLIPSFDAQKGKPYLQRFAQPDWVGIVLFSGAIVSLVLALTFGGNQFAWNSGQVIGTFVTFGVLMAIFAFSQTLYMPGQTKAKRVFPVEMLFMKTTVLLFIETATAGAIVFTCLYYIPLYFQFTRGDSALQAAVRLLPFIFLTVFGSIFGGGMISQLGYYSPFYIFGTALALIGAALLHTMGQFTSTSAIYGYSVLVGLGAGLYSQQGFAVAQVKVAPEQVGQALGFLATGQLVGVVVTLSIAGTVLVNTATTGLLALFPDVPVATLKNAIAGTAGDFLTSLSPQLKTAALDVIVQSMDKVWILTITAAAVGFVCSVFLKFEKVNIKPGAAA